MVEKLLVEEVVLTRISTLFLFRTMVEPNPIGQIVNVV